MTVPARSDDDRQRRFHARYRLLAAAAVDGRIDPEDAADLEGHLLTCELCSADLSGMRADHRLLAEPARVVPPDPRIRAVILDAARAPRVPRLGATQRPWAALLAAGLVVAVVGAGLFLASLRPTTPGAVSSPSATDRVPPALWSVPPNEPFGRAVDARLLGNSVGASPEILVSAIVIGGVDAVPAGYVELSDPSSESWIGSITRASYGYDASGQWYVARLEGCRASAPEPCRRYALQLIDGRDRADGQDEISLSFLEPGDDDPEPWSFWYRLVGGDIEVAGGAADPGASPSVPVGIANGHFAPFGSSPGALDVDIQLLGRVEDGGSAAVEIVGPFGEAWTGRVTSSLFWADAGDPRGSAWVAYMEGCKSGTSCDAFQLMLVDGRDIDGKRRIALDFYPSLAEIDPEGPYNSYELTSGSLNVTGPIEVIP